MIKHYCRTCATMEHVQEYRWQGGTVYLCDDCKRDFWQGIVAEGRSMNKKEIYKKLEWLIFTHLGVKVEEEEQDATLADMGADSLDAVELAYAIEDEFDIEIPDKDFSRNYGDMTVKNLMEYVAKKMEG